MDVTRLLTVKQLTSISAAPADVMLWLILEEKRGSHSRVGGTIFDKTTCVAMSCNLLQVS